MVTKWDCETTIKFVRAYSSHECLWNFKSALYKNKHLRESAYRKIVETINISGFGVLDVKNKIKNLRSTYAQEKRKIEDSKKSGAEGNHCYVSNLKWLKELECVYKDSDKIQFHDSMELDTFTQTENSSHVNEEPANKKTRAESPHIEYQPASSKERPRDIVRAVADLKSSHESINSQFDEDAFDIFGKSIAVQLKKLSEERGLIAQNKIQNLLTEFAIADLREKNRPTYGFSIIDPTSVLSLSSRDSYDSISNPLEIKSSESNLTYDSLPTLKTESDPIQLPY